jgi:hypothetical protein
MAKMVTIPDAAEFLGLTEDQVYRLIGTGDLEVTIALDLVSDRGPGDHPSTAEPDGTQVISRMRITSTVLSAYRLSRGRGAA